MSVTFRKVGSSRALIGLAVAFAAVLGGPAVKVSSAAVAVQIDTGAGHSCAVLSNRTVRCWGANDFGQLGDRTTSPRSTPVSVPGISNAISVAAGDAGSCARLLGGSIICWGANDTGVLGDGTTADSLVPVTVKGITTATQLAVGDGFACAIVSGGAIRCWGANDSGQLGNGTYVQSSSPVSVAGISGATQLALGSAHACAVLPQGVVKCWGANDLGSLGNGRWIGSATPVFAYSITGASKIAAGSAHSCAVVSLGLLYCWGRGDVMQLGDQLQDPAGASIPLKSLGISHAAEVAAGDGHTCVRFSGGTVSCFGGDYFGQLGDGTTSHGDGTPIAVTGLTGVAEISARGDHSCALRTTGQVLCWGDNGDGQLGDGTTANRSAPVAVLGLSTPPAAPLITTKPAAFSNARTASFSFTAEFGNSTSCQLDGGAWQNCVSPKTYVGLADGSHRFAVRSTDPGGTISSSATSAWTIDTVAPVITGKVTVSLAAGITSITSTCAPSAGLPATLEWSSAVTQPSAGADPAGARVLPWAGRVTINGAQVVRWVRVADSAGNRSGWVKVG